MSEIYIATSADAKEFYDQGMGEFNKLLIDERIAKEAFLVGLIAVENVLYLGPPGGGKTQILENVYRLFKGVGPDQFASIPHNSDLTPRQVVGGRVSGSKDITENGVTRTETSITNVDPLVTGKTVVLGQDEINRESPHVVNAMLDALESRVIVNTAGRLELTALRAVVAAMNPADYSTFPLPGAGASRYALGAQLGTPNPDHNKRANLIKEVGINQWEAKLDEITPFIEDAKIVPIQRGMRKHPFPETSGNYFVDLVTGIVRTLEGQYIYEADARIARQLGRLSRTVSFLHGESQVQRADMHRAVRYIVTARMGAMKRVHNQDIEPAIVEAIGSEPEDLAA